MARSDYKICPECGAALDAGEICDCHRPATMAQEPTENDHTGEIIANVEGMVLYCPFPVRG